MNWKNLKNNKCPKCGKDTAIASPYEYSPLSKVLAHPCGFKIRESRYKEIVTSMTNQEIEAIREEENDGR